MIIRIIEKLKENNRYYLIFPLLFILFWTFYALIHENFYLNKLNTYSDFEMFYLAGRQVLINPAELYSIYGYLYFPFFALLMAPISYFIPFWEAHLFFFGIQLILTIYTIFLWNRILKIVLKDKKLIASKYYIHILYIPYFSWFIYAQFYQPQSKMIVFSIFLYCFYILLESKQKDNLSLKKWAYLSFLIGIALSITPHFIFMCLIFVFDDLPFNRIFKNKEAFLYSLKKIGIFVSILLAQNCLLFIFPNLILDVFDPFLSFGHSTHTMNVYYFYGWNFVIDISLLALIYLVLLIIINLIISFSKMDIVRKITYSSVSYLLFCYYGMWDEHINLVFLYLFFFSFLKYEKTILEFIKNNFWLLLGILGILLINVLPLSLETYRYFSFIPDPFRSIIITLRYYPSFILMGICLLYIIKVKDCHNYFKEFGKETILLINR
jgi:hypothetical protein